MSGPPDTPRRPALSSVALEANGNGRDHRQEPETREELIDRAILQCDERFGHIARELSSIGSRLDGLERRQSRAERNQEAQAHEHRRLAGHVASTMAPGQYRDRAPSYSDLDEEITLNGTKLVKGTPEQLQAIIDARIAEATQRARLESAAAPVMFVRSKVAPAAVLTACGAAITAFVAWVIGRLQHHP